MDAVLQKSMDMTVELTASGKSGRQGFTVATLRADRVSSIPVDHDNKNNNSVVLAGKWFNAAPKLHVYVPSTVWLTGAQDRRLRVCLPIFFDIDTHAPLKANGR